MFQIRHITETKPAGSAASPSALVWRLSGLTGGQEAPRGTSSLASYLPTYLIDNVDLFSLGMARNPKAEAPFS